MDYGGEIKKKKNKKNTHFQKISQPKKQKIKKKKKKKKKKCDPVLLNTRDSIPPHGNKYNFFSLHYTIAFLDFRDIITEWID